MVFGGSGNILIFNLCNSNTGMYILWNSLACTYKIYTLLNAYFSLIKSLSNKNIIKWRDIIEYNIFPANQILAIYHWSTFCVSSLVPKTVGKYKKKS